MTYSTTLKLNQRFETYEEFLNVLNTESKKNFDIWTKVDSRKNNVGGYLYVKFKCIYYNKLDSHLKSASVGIRKIQHVNKGCECPAEIILSWNSSYKTQSKKILIKSIMLTHILLALVLKVLAKLVFHVVTFSLLKANLT